MFEKKLKEIRCADQFASIYTDESTKSKFTFGKVINIGEDFFAIKLISPEGKPDGLLVKEIDSIFRIELNSKYNNKMMILLNENTEKNEDYLIDDNDIVLSTLLCSKKFKLIVSLEILESGYDDIVGFVDSVENGLCKIKQIDEYGDDNGDSFVSLLDITQISCNSSDEKIIHSLCKERHIEKDKNL